MQYSNLELNTTFLSCPQLETKHLLLKQATLKDAEAILALRGNETAMKYLDRPKAKTIEDAITYINSVNEKLVNSDGISWGIFLKEQPNILIGTMGLWRIDKPHFRAEIGYMLLPTYFRQGIMQEAMEVCIKYGFEQINLHSIEAIINPNNIASKNILQKNGFIQEAYFKENYFYNGEFLDSAVFSLLRIAEY